MKLFFRYVKTKTFLLFACFICVTIFLISFAMYHLPIMAVVYPTIVCILFGTVFIIVDFLRKKEVYDTLSHLSGLTAEMIDTLPEPHTIIEEEYADLAASLKEQVRDIRSEDREKYSGMIDYYTVWAHQIKTPIAAMKLTLQNDDSALSSRLSSDLFRIEQYVEMVLAYLRLDSDTSDYVFREYDVDEIVRSSVKKFASEFIMRHISLDYEPVSIRAVTDEKWLAFVLEQIISNALKYTASDGVVSVKKTADNVISISDTGIGIAKADLPRIFEKGYTGNNGRADRRASGLGLYLCKRICLNLGITLSASSTVGVGTVISLDLTQSKAGAD